MFRQIRIWVSVMVAGTIGMLAGLAGQIYVYEFSNRSAVLLQAASVFGEIDEFSLCVVLVSLLFLLYECLKVEWKRWYRRYRNVHKVDSRKTL